MTSDGVAIGPGGPVVAIEARGHAFFCGSNETELISAGLKTAC